MRDKAKTRIEAARKRNRGRDREERSVGFAAVIDCTPALQLRTVLCALECALSLEKSGDPEWDTVAEAYCMVEDAERFLRTDRGFTPQTLTFAQIRQVLEKREPYPGEPDPASWEAKPYQYLGYCYKQCHGPQMMAKGSQYKYGAYGIYVCTACDYGYPPGMEPDEVEG